MIITDPVRYDPRSGGDSLFGMDVELAFESIGGGQADFDSQDGNLSPDDKALLYAYLNQKGHIEELATAFGQIFVGSSPPNPIIVDIGCGPFTGGLALAATLGSHVCFDYIGVDRAKSMLRLAKRLAASQLVPGYITTHWAANIASVNWPHHPAWREVIVVVSYLFASSTLDAESMFKDLDRLLRRLGRGAVTLLYTNTPRDDCNRQYPGFRETLKEAGFQVLAEDHGEIVIERSKRHIGRRLRYALFRRRPLRTLMLGE